MEPINRQAARGINYDQPKWYSAGKSKKRSPRATWKSNGILSSTPSLKETLGNKLITECTALDLLEFRTSPKRVFKKITPKKSPKKRKKSVKKQQRFRTKKST